MQVTVSNGLRNRMIDEMESQLAIATPDDLDFCNEVLEVIKDAKLEGTFWVVEADSDIIEYLHELAELLR